MSVPHRNDRPRNQIIQTLIPGPGCFWTASNPPEPSRSMTSSSLDPFRGVNNCL